MNLLKTIDLGVDLGTSNVLIYVDGKGIVVKEPTVIAMDRNEGKILQVGAAAKVMMGRTPGNVVAMKPLTGGIISDHEMTVRMLSAMFKSAAKGGLLTPKPRVVITVPSGITEVEERNVINAAIEAGARRVFLIEEPLASALGAGMEIDKAKGNMVVDIGGGTTNIAVLSMNGVVNSSSLRIAGDFFDEAIARYVRRKHNVIIGQVTAESVKITLGQVYPGGEEMAMDIKGRDAKTGVPRVISITSTEVFGILQKHAVTIADEVTEVLSHTKSELVGDIAETGITLTGGCAQIAGMDKLIEEKTQIPCKVADEPASCAAYGCGKSLSWIKSMKEGPINIARKRMMNSTQG